MSTMWTAIESPIPAFRHRYEFEKGAVAHALALVVNGGVIVVSAPPRPTAESFSELDAHGPVRALVAPNGFHTMGLSPWHEHYPDAALYAPSSAIARVQKQTQLAGIRPVAELSAQLGNAVEFVEMPHYKIGEALVRWRLREGWAWYVTDIIMNITAPPPFPFNLIFKLTKSAPGLRRNALSQLLMIKDKKALYRWVVEQAEATPPRLVVPSHGEPAQLRDPRAEILAAVS